jgi:multidrug resistance efflux pump
MAFPSKSARNTPSVATPEPEASVVPMPAERLSRGNTAFSAHGLDIAGRLKLLKDAFEKNTWSDDPAHGHPALAWVPQAKSFAHKNRAKLIKLLAGIAIVAAVGYLPVRTLLQTTSTEAIINARLVTLRAPIEGEVGTGVNSLVVGTQLDPGAPLIRIANRRADRGRLDDLRRLIGQLEGERAAMATRNTDLRALHAELADQTHAFKGARERQLAARAAELKSEAAGAAANKVEAERALARATPLHESGTITPATFEQVKRDVTVTTEAEAALRHRLAGVEVERDALARGVFVGDSYNDQPRSSQRADEIAQRLSEGAADLRARDVRLEALRTELAEETQRFEAVAATELTAPVRGSVWEVLTAPGETVVRGQELVRLLDCSGLVVTATVGETAYNRLKIGAPARFRLRGESVDHKGRIIGLTGVATAPANLAIQPAALAKEPYRVTVLLPEMARAGHCDVGRTGRVTFE